MNLRNFEEFVRSGTVRRQKPDVERARSLLTEAEKKKEFLNTALTNIPEEQMSPNFVVDSCYDILLEIIRAKLFMDGFNSGGSHEAEVSYTRNLGFPESDVRFMNELRYYRNGIKYYGTILDKEYAKKVLEFMEKIYPKLKQMVAAGQEIL